MSPQRGLKCLVPKPLTQVLSAEASQESSPRLIYQLPLPPVSPPLPPPSLVRPQLPPVSQPVTLTLTKQSASEVLGLTFTFGQNTATLCRVEPDSPAWNFGLRAGDVVTTAQVGSTTIRLHDGFEAAMFLSKMAGMALLTVHPRLALPELAADRICAAFTAYRVRYWLRSARIAAVRIQSTWCHTLGATKL